MYLPQLLTFLTAVASIAEAHPGHDISEEIAERRDFLRSVRRSSLAHCAETLKARGVEASNIARRSAAVENRRAARGLQRRDVGTVLSTSHNSTDLGYTEDTSVSELFSSNRSCLLTPEVTIGPYYVGGEDVRKDVTDSEPGVEITLDYQVIDVDTCEPAPNVYVEIWSCNATGVYSGVVARGNGDASDQSNINNKALRGIQPTDQDGVAQFQSIFPGHYTGRATHIHILVHAGATLYENGTLGNEVSSSHVGQTFFDQELISAVTATAPYNTNQQRLTTNANDGILAQEAATNGVDPVMSYVYLGDTVSDGLFAWLAFGINTTRSNEVTPAVVIYESGGVDNSGRGNPDAGGTPSGGGDGPSGTQTGGTGTKTGETGSPPSNNGGSVARASMAGLLGLVCLVLAIQ